MKWFVLYAGTIFDDAPIPYERLEFVEGKVDWKGRQALKNKHGGLWTSSLVLGMYPIFVLIMFALESMATISLAVNFVTYFNGVMHFQIADAANMVTNYMGVSYILSIVAAVFADTHLGRHRTAVISGCLELMGLSLLAFQAHNAKLKPPPCNILDPTTAHCEKVGGGNAVLLFVALFVLAAGSSGTKASVPSHGADQFDEKDPKELIQMSSYFNFVLLAVCFGAAVSLTVFVWIQDNKGWDWGFGVGAISMLLAVIIFIAGLPMHRIHVVQGSSTVVEILQVYVAAFRNRKLQLPGDPLDLFEINKDKEAAIAAEFLPHRDTLRFLDKAAIQTSTEKFSEAPNPWKLCRVTQVENAKIILGILPVFSCTIIMTLCLAQLQTFSIQQGLTMDTSITKSFNIPPASLPIIPVIFLIILVPIYDRLIVPFARKFTGLPTGITHLQRIGVGLILSSISMASAALLEVKRKDVARDHNMLDAIPVLQPLPISTFWISIQFFIFGIADMFTYVGLLEFFYSEAPKGLKSISSCFLWSSMALGYFLSTILVNIVNATTRSTKSGGWLAGNNINRNNLNLFYWLLSILSLINFCAYLFVSTRYKCRPQNASLPSNENRDAPTNQENGGREN
ncbi:hypothetical protein SADUNF_Sadunf04G0043800 [Salix dunnii]|uniref:Uncharacterized protein n=1 Tax=Salix dunnii TaxID=1413687 RepID=A0A835N2N3_9ROSI|nr:hypothetical protein SADUNF_Sadunf04G0043800 [Salix dunnii]